MRTAVLCPTRGNPDALFEAAASFKATAMGDTSFIPVIDETDDASEDYFESNEDVGLFIEVVPRDRCGNMNLALNFAALRAAEDYDVVGFIGDDHRFRTRGWDRVVAAVLESEGGGIAYADDLAQRERLPTQVFMSSAIIRSLGWMGLPDAKHLYLDNTWRELGERADCLYYLPDIVIEHMHPAYGKGEWDEGHVRVNSEENYSHDLKIYEAWLAGPATQDVERVRTAITSA